jgi:hypothetical protein
MTGYDEPAAVLTRLLHAIDALHWSGVRDCLADQVETDYTELFGGEVQRGSGDELVSAWQGLLPGFDATQHLTGPVLTKPDGADLLLSAHVRGYHRVAGAEGGEVWGVHGHYRARLTQGDDDWRISELALRMFYQEGNTGLPELAAKRAASSPRKPRPEIA